MSAVGRRATVLALAGLMLARFSTRSIRPCRNGVTEDDRGVGREISSRGADPSQRRMMRACWWPLPPLSPVFRPDCSSTGSLPTPSSWPRITSSTAAAPCARRRRNLYRASVRECRNEQAPAAGREGVSHGSLKICAVRVPAVTQRYGRDPFETRLGPDAGRRAGAALLAGRLLQPVILLGTLALHALRGSLRFCMR